MATLKHGQTGDRYLLTVTNKASTDFHPAIPPPIQGFAIGVDSRRTFNLCLPLLVEYREGRETASRFYGPSEMANLVRVALNIKE